MSSHFTEQSNVARARQLSWSKRSKIRASFDEAHTHSLIQMGWFEARGGLPSTGQGPRKYCTTFSICKLQIPARLVGRSVGWACCNWFQKWPKRRPGRGLHSSSFMELRKTLHGHRLGRPVRRCALLDAGFLSLPCAMHSLHPSAQLPGKSRHQRHGSVTLQWSPCPARMYNLPDGR